MSKLSIFDAGVLQPWGLLDDQKSRSLSKTAPTEWNIHATPVRDRAAHFGRWRDDVLEEINTVLWPRYDAVGQAWVGAKADRQYMDDLTKADLLLMREMRHPEFGPGIFHELPDSPLRRFDISPHKPLFDTEDGGAPLEPHKLYDRTISDDKVFKFVQDAFGQIDGSRQDPINFWFKNQLQRPRPMQMALRMGHMDFVYNIAKTSITPSMCSGHSLQGVMCLGGSLERLLDMRFEYTPDRLQAHGQWSVDFGDRRVMAGIHFPSDNLCSWLIFLKAARFIFRRPEVWLTIGYAIRNLSFVYKTIRCLVDTGRQEGKPYADALKLLDQWLPPENVTLEGILKDPAQWLEYQP